MTDTGTVRKIVRVNGTTMKVPIWCVELHARVQVCFSKAKIKGN